MPKGVDFTAVLHLDESHVHIHILAMNTPDPKLDANKLHAGKVAAARWRDANESDVIAPLPKPELVTRPLKPKKRRPSKNRQTQAKHDAEHIAAVAAWEQACAPIDATNAELMVAWEARNKDHIRAARQKRGKAGVQRAYDAAMKKLQDDYYEAVGKQCGLLRFGPRQARKSTKVYNAEKEQARRSAKTYADAEQIRLPISLRPEIASMAFSAARTIWSANSTICWPAAVRRGGREVRSNNGAPTSCSSAWICWLTADTVRWTASAAREKLPDSMMARRVLSWRVSIVPVFLKFIFRITRFVSEDLLV